MPPVYLDYQASTPLFPEVKEKMMQILSEFSGNPHSETHLHGREANLIVETARHNLSDMIGADSESVIFTSGATEANNFLVRQGAAINKKRHTILISSLEHKCVLESAYALAPLGYKIIEIKTDTNGQVDLEHYQDCLSEDVALVSIMSANNEIGTIANIPDLVKMAHLEGAFFHTDAAQHTSHETVDIDIFDADFISFSAHKMYGPKGIGAAYVASHLFDKIQPLIDGGGQQNGKRSGTLSPLLCGGFGEAAMQFIERGDKIRAETKALRNRFYGLLREELGDQIELIGPAIDRRHIGNLNIQFEESASTLLGRLAPSISASNGSACSSGQIDVSHVLSAIGLDRQSAENCVRFGFGPGLKNSEIDTAILAITSVLKT